MKKQSSEPPDEEIISLLGKILRRSRYGGTVSLTVGDKTVTTEDWERYETKRKAKARHASKAKPQG